MSCPHGCGDPKFCSQCQGAKPKVMTRDPGSGQLYQDGVAVTTRSFVLAPGRPSTARRGRPRKNKAPAAAVEVDPDERADPAE